MTDTEQYRLARAKAREIREKYGLGTPRVMVSDLRKIYRSEGIDRIDYHDGFQGTRIKGAYFNDEAGCSVMVNKKLISQIEPKVFTLAHELKHHLMDPIRVVSLCSDNNEHVAMERAADAFASELMYPASLFIVAMEDMGIEKNTCTPEDIVHLKHRTKTTLSHTALAIKALALGYAAPGSLSRVQWHLLRNRLYPEYTMFRS